MSTAPDGGAPDGSHQGDAAARPHAGPTPLDRLASRLMDTDEAAVDRLPVAVAEELPGNAVRQVVALAFQKAGDLVVDPRTVLTWLLTSLGAPAAVIGLLVPIRESGSMLPQVLIARAVRRRRVRKWIWVGGALGQAVAVGAIAVIAATTQGPVAGWGILGALAAFAVDRSLNSLTTKDVLGRTIPKGTRGQVTGTATVASGVVAVTLGVALRTFGGEQTQAGTLALLIGIGALAWVAAAGIFATVVEVPGDADEDPGSQRSALALLRDDAPFRRFVLTRTLLLVSALSPPFVVALATAEGGAGLAGLGPFLISSGVAALLGGRFWGRLADRSSRLTMSIAGAAAAGIILALLVALRVDTLRSAELLYPLAYLLLAIAHTGVRIGRSTYVVDLGEGNRRTDYVAVSNSAMGVLLLVAGAITAAIATLGAEAALLSLAVLGLLGVIVSRTLPDVSAG